MGKQFKKRIFSKNKKTFTDSAKKLKNLTPLSLKKLQRIKPQKPDKKQQKLSEHDKQQNFSKKLN